uniref:Uncharacterized protein n=1 Tax=Pan troglodytes TaxID=9598 RepID=A0A2I3RNA3_PANTR
MQYQTTQYIIHHRPPPQVFTGFCSRYGCQNPVIVPQRCQTVLSWSLQLHLKPFSANPDSYLKYAFPSAPGPFPMLGDLKKSRMGRVGLTEVELNPLFLYNVYLWKILGNPYYCQSLLLSYPLRLPSKLLPVRKPLERT